MTMHRRLAKEMPLLRAKTLLQDGFAIEEEPVDGIQAEPVPKPGRGNVGRAGAGASNDTRFIACLAGPKDSPYEGGVFRLQVRVPAMYPMEPPKISFVTKLFHPNIGRGHTPGAICLDILRKEAWSPALTLERTFLSIASLLGDPNPASPMDSEAARLYENDRPAYEKRVREWVEKYASPPSTRGAEGGAWISHMGKPEAATASGGADSAGVGGQSPIVGTVGETQELQAAEQTAASVPEVVNSATFMDAGVAERKTAAVATAAIADFVIDVSDDEPQAKKARAS